MPKLKKDEEKLDIAAGVHLFTHADRLDEDDLPPGMAFVGRVAKDSHVVIGATPIGEVNRAFADWKSTVKGVDRGILDAVAMHIAFQLNEEEREKVMRDWFNADAAARVQLVTDMHGVITQ